MLRATLAVAAGALAAATTAGAAVFPVADEAQLREALAKAKAGDTIRLSGAPFPALTISNRRYDRPVEILGSGGTTLAGLTISGSRGLTIRELEIRPEGERQATVKVKESSGVVFERVKLDGVSSDRGVQFDIDRDSSGIRIVASEFTNCRSGRPCLQPSGRDISIIGSHFHDCIDCDMIRAGGSAITIRGSTFERALPGPCSADERCPHNDLIQIMGGGPWTIVGNRFGERKRGAAQIFANHGRGNTANPIHDVTIESNVFWGDMLFSVRLGPDDDRKSVLGPARNVRIVNNTITSGRAGAIFLSPHYASMPPEQRPLVANNILSVSKTTGCDRMRAAANLILVGKACAPNDRVGAANLDAAYGPVAATSLAVDAGDARYAPIRDHFGRPRVGRPDIGAIEFRGAAALTVPARITRRLASLAAEGWRLRFSVGTRGVARVTVRVIRGGTSRLALQRRIAAEGRAVVLVPIPAFARAPGTATLVVGATTADGGSLERRIALTLRP
jgi:hypothetical protein